MTERNVILQGVVGSTAYGMATETSDVDRLGIFQVNTLDYLGRFQKADNDESSAENKKDSFVSHNPEDIQLHELGKFFRLASECNPTITELLWLPSFEIRTEMGGVLVSRRGVFLGARQIRARYGGYADSQRKRLVRRGNFDSDLKKRQAKHGRHCARLCIQAIELLKTGSLSVRLSSEMAAQCFEWGKMAEDDPDAYFDAVQPLIDEVDASNTELPEEADFDAIRDLLVEMRMLSLNEEMG